MNNLNYTPKPTCPNANVSKILMQTTNQYRIASRSLYDTPRTGKCAPKYDASIYTFGMIHKAECHACQRANGTRCGNSASLRLWHQLKFIRAEHLFRESERERESRFVASIIPLPNARAPTPTDAMRGVRVEGLNATHSSART